MLAANAGSDRTPTGDEREHLWLAFVEMYPQAEHYTRFTDRELPLVALAPASS